MKVLVAYDGTRDAKAALVYGIKKVLEHRGELVAVHVFESNRFIDYDGGPKAEELAKREAIGHMEEALAFLRRNGEGVPARVVFSEGNTRSEVLRHAHDEDVDIIVAPPSLSSLVDTACCLVDIVSADEEEVSPDLLDRANGIVGTQPWQSA